MCRAIVIGIDGYGGEIPNLSAAVDDAESFYEWLVSGTGANVPKENVKLLLGRAPGDSEQSEDERVPTKDNIMGAINELMRESNGIGETLFFYFAGHGITSTYANREESAIAAADFDNRHPERTLAVRSITEFFETTQFQDQFFFIDACRVDPPSIESEIGGWTIPRRRDPGQLPVQQFILYATAPGQEAKELGWPGEAVGAFSGVLLGGLSGEGRAKAWSWERNCYEIRWERLTEYVKRRMEGQQLSDTGERRWVQVPQDAGCRGVLNRERDARLTTLSGRGVASVELTLDLKAESQDAVNLVVLNGLGEPVATALSVTGSSYTFRLPPRTYAVSATTADGRRKGRLLTPLELYDDDDGIAKTPVEIDWSSLKEEGEGDGEIKIRSPDPLAVAEVRDQTGRFIGLATRETGCAAPRGYYRLRQLGPEPRSTGAEYRIVLRAGERQRVDLPALPEESYAEAHALAKALGGSRRKGCVIPVAGAEPVAWAQPSTVVVAGIDAVLHDQQALEGLALESPLAEIGTSEAGIALYVVAARGESAALQGLSARMWPAGETVPKERKQLDATEGGVAAAVWPVEAPGPHWLSIESTNGAEPTVVALPVLKGRLATLVAQVEPGRLRLYQFHPALRPDPSSKPDRLRRLEHLQRSLLGGRVDGALDLANEVAKGARDDPFAGCLAGYVLLRLGSHEPLKDLAAAIVEVAPKLSDAYILRGEYEAHGKNTEARNQAFADAVGTGVPAFGEGLTRLVEGLRAGGFVHPRGALVRYVFQRHARGSMWSAFTPRNTFKAGRLVITGADVGYEG